MWLDAYATNGGLLVLALAEVRAHVQVLGLGRSWRQTQEPDSHIYTYLSLSLYLSLLLRTSDWEAMRLRGFRGRSWRLAVSCVCFRFGRSEAARLSGQVVRRLRFGRRKAAFRKGLSRAWPVESRLGKAHWPRCERKFKCSGGPGDRRRSLIHTYIHLSLSISLSFFGLRIGRR